jgi:hypothetical protein
VLWTALTIAVALVPPVLAPVAATAADPLVQAVCPGGGVCVPAPPIQPPQPVRLIPSPNPTASPAPSPSPVLPPGPPDPVVPVTPDDNLQAVGRWVFGGANWSVCQIPRIVGLSVDAVRCPPDQAVTVRLPQPRDWFAPLYRRMVEIAGLLMLPMLLLAFLQALLRQDSGLAIRAAFGYVPLAVVLSAVAVSLTQTLLAVTDSLSDFMLNGYQGQVAGTIAGLAGVLAAGAAGSVFTVGTSAAAVIAALVAIVAALAIVIELLARQALIYAGVLFLPLSFAGMVWPSLARWAQRLVEVVVVAVFAKFLIVSVLVLGAAAFTSPGGGGPFDSQAPPGSTLLVGLLLVGLAALSPVALLWMLPTFESAVLAQFHGAAHRPVQMVPSTIERSAYHLGLHRMWRERARSSERGAGPVMVFHPGTQVIVRPPRYAPGPGGPASPRGSGPGGRPYPGPPTTRPMTHEKDAGARA